MDACYAQTECHDKAVNAYNKHKRATSQLVKKWKTECVALKKISCYVKVWLKDGDVEVRPLLACSHDILGRVSQIERRLKDSNASVSHIVRSRHGPEPESVNIDRE